MHTPTPPARLWLVRHGQTDFNLQGRIQGHLPTELNATGRAQADQLAGYFAGKPFKALYSSDLPRAAQTAAVIAARLGLAVQTTDRLRERSLGPYEGKTSEELRALQSKARAGAPGSGDLADWTGIPDVETDEALWTRTAAVLRDISLAHPAQDVLIVTHGGVLSRVVYATLGIARGHRRRFALSNGITLILEHRDDTFYLLSLVDMALLVDHQLTPDTASGPITAKLQDQPPPSKAIP